MPKPEPSNPDSLQSLLEQKTNNLNELDVIIEEKRTNVFIKLVTSDPITIIAVSAIITLPFIAYFSRTAQEWYPFLALVLIVALAFICTLFNGSRKG